jgi:hypothetical protein
MAISRDAFGKLAEAILEGGARKATKYFSPTEVVKATRVTFRRGGTSRITEIRFTIGKPNCAEREFIKKCQLAGERFPVRKIQLRFATGKR